MGTDVGSERNEYDWVGRLLDEIQWMEKKATGTSGVSMKPPPPDAVLAGRP